MKNKLQKHFPMIRTKGEALEAIKNNKSSGEFFAVGKKNTSRNTWMSALGSGD